MSTNKNLPSTNEDSDSALDILERVQLPKQYKVILLNDDYTPMDFVVMVLKRFFSKSEEEAMKIMLQVHHNGKGIAGVYSLEVSEMKLVQVHSAAKQSRYPLKCVLEEA